MEVLEFMLNTWWYASILMFVVTIIKEKLLNGIVTIKELVNAFIIGVAGYFSLLLLLVAIIVVALEKIGDKKLF